MESTLNPDHEFMLLHSYAERLKLNQEIVESVLRESVLRESGPKRD